MSAESRRENERSGTSDARPLALVRRPGRLLSQGLVTHQERVPIDVELARRQWSDYVASLSDNGWAIAHVDPADECPDAVFIEDAVVVFGDLAVVARSGAASRRPEASGAEEAVRRLGLSVARIDAPGILDGGDVLKVDRTVYVGVGGRTNEQAVAQLESLLGPQGWQVRAVPVHRVLHLKSAVTALPDGTIIGYRDNVDDEGAFDRFMAMPEPEGAHVVLLGDDRLLASTTAPRSIAKLDSMGFETVPVDISEFEKLEGCVTCLSVRIRDGIS